MSTDHTCNGGCHRCMSELDISYWMHRHQIAERKADTYRELLQRIVSAMPELPTVHYFAEAHVQVLALHDFLTAVHDARRMITDEHS